MMLSTKQKKTKKERSPKDKEIHNNNKRKEFCLFLLRICGKLSIFILDFVGKKCGMERHLFVLSFVYPAIHSFVHPFITDFCREKQLKQVFKIFALFSSSV